MPFSARQAAGSTFHCCAAAAISISRAAAPAKESRSHSERTLVLPPVTMIGPNWAWLYSGATGDGLKVTFFQSQQSSSATSMGSEV